VTSLWPVVNLRLWWTVNRSTRTEMAREIFPQSFLLTNEVFNCYLGGKGKDRQ